ncbi:MAG: sporulation protein YunB [Defluviitaleaceae bacterium]|nr:sporulation protein YunB [Defluviitaleaceae bacterium]
MGKKLRGIQRWWRRRGVGTTTRVSGAENPARSKGLEGWLYDDTPTPATRSSRSARGGKSTKREGFRLPRGFVLFTMLILFVIAFIHAFYRFDRQILPLVLEAAELRIQTEINNVINAVVQDIIVANQVTAADFILHSELGANAKPVLSVNTVLVNEICNAAAQAISERLNNLEPEIASVPIGMALGLDTLAQMGPRFTFTLAPVGNALVNHESTFTAVGINQTHFSVFLTVESVVRIINPVQSSEIQVTRQVSLVDTIISGTVPGTYLNMDTPVVNLN